MLKAHLLKELREQRQALAVMLIALPTIGLAFGLLAPKHLVPLDVAIWFLLGALLLGLIVLGGDLVPGERRRGQLDFLARTPGALRASFAAKWIVLLAGLAGLAATGLGAGLLCDALAEASPDTTRFVAGIERVQRRQASSVDGFPPLLLLLYLGLLLPWTFTCSCWLKRSSAVLPVTLAVLAVMLAPLILLVDRYPGPDDHDASLVGWNIAIATGVLAAWRSFVPGLRFGSAGRSLLLGLGSAMFFVVPATVWSVHRIHQARHVDPTEAELRLESGFVSPDYRICVLNVERNWSTSRQNFVLWVDLETGGWNQVGDGQAHANRGVAFDELAPLRDPHEGQAWCGLTLEGPVFGSPTPGRAVLNLRSGQIVPLDLGAPLPEEVDASGQAMRTEATTLRLPDGGSARIEPTRAVVTDAEGRREEIPYPEGHFPIQVVGFGVILQPASARNEESDQNPVVLDLTRRRVIEPRNVGVIEYVRPGRWVQYPSAWRDSSNRLTWRIELWDPEHDTTNYALLAERERLLGIANDGRLLVRGHDGRVDLLDPDTRSRRQMPIASGLRLAVSNDIPQRRSSPSLTTPDGREVWPLRIEGKGQAYARRDGDLLRVTQVDARHDSVRLLAVPDNDHVLVIRGGRRIERWEFGSDRFELLFRVGPR